MFLNTAGDTVVGIPLPPGGLGLAAARRLALRLPTSPLSYSDSWIWAEPMAADAAGSFSSIRHGDYHHRAIRRVSRGLAGRLVGHF